MGQIQRPLAPGSDELPRAYDVVVVSDFGAGGDFAAEVATEIRVQAAAGYATGVMPAMGEPGAGFDARVATCVRQGLADLLLPGSEVRARLLLVRMPPVVRTSLRLRASVSAERAVVVFDASHAACPDVLRGVAAEILLRVGCRPEWVPTSRESRETPPPARAGEPPPSWDPVVEVAAASRQAAAGRPAIIGWCPPTEVGHRAHRVGLRRLHRRLTRTWQVVDLDVSRSAITGADVVVSMASPLRQGRPIRWVLDALAAGVPVVLEPSARPALGDACLYSEPSGLPDLLRGLLSDPAEWERWSLAGMTEVAERFGEARHLERLDALVGRPTGTPRPSASVRRELRRRVLFVSSNGAGVGHLTRLLAMAKRLPDDVEPVFFTMSQAVSVVRRMGYPCEYLASSGYTGMEAGTWNRWLTSRLTELLETLEPQVVVFDGTYPYRGLLNVAQRFPHVAFVWSRRSMWKKGAGKRSTIAKAGEFRLVVEPGELAEDADRGLTVSHRAQAERVDPILLLDRDELLSREDARAELGIEDDRPAVLVQLGAGNIDDAASVASIVHEQLRQVEGLQVCATSHPIARQGEPESSDVHVVSVYPLSRYLRAFDFGITAPGYNSFHEFVTFGVPAIFVANTQTSVDDQAARGRWAEAAGVGIGMDQFTPEAFAGALARMLDPPGLDSMRRACEERARSNGSRDAAALLAGLVEHASQGPPMSVSDRMVRLPNGGSRRLSRREALASRVRARMRTSVVLRRLTRRPGLPRSEARSAGAGRPGALPVLAGNRVGPGCTADLPVVLLICLGARGDELTKHVEAVATLQAERQGFRPLFVVDSDDLALFRGYDYLFEYVMPPDDWAMLSGGDDWPLYVERRLRQISAAFLPDVVIDLAPPSRGSGLADAPAVLGVLAGVSIAGR